MMKSGDHHTPEARSRMSSSHKTSVACQSALAQLHEFNTGRVGWHKKRKHSSGSRLRQSATWRANYAAGKFIHPNTGKRLNVKTCAKKSETMLNKYANGYTHPRLGTHHTTDARRKLILSHIGKPSPMRGKCHTPTAKSKMSKAHLRSYASGRIAYMTGRSHSESARNKIRVKRLLQIFPTRDTLPERLLQDELARREIGFYPHYPVIGQPDIAFPDQKVAVFVDGDYWHNLQKQKERDVKVTAELRRQGWTVLRFWEHEVKQNPSIIITALKNCGLLN